MAARGGAPKKSKMKDGVRQVGRAFYVKYVRATGKPVERKVSARSWTEARRLRAELILREDRIRLGLEVESVAETLRQASERYVAQWRGRSRATFVGRWKRIHEAPLARMVLQQVTPGDVTRFLDALEAEKLSAQTVKHFRNTLRAFFNWAARERLVRGPNPAALARPVAVRRPRVSVPTLEQMGQVLGAAEAVGGPGWWLLVLTAALTGARLGELLGLRWEDVHLERGLVTFRASYDATTKTGLERSVPLHDDLLPRLKAARARATGPYVFPDESGRMRPRGWKATLLFTRTLKAAGLTAGVELVCPRGARAPGRRNGRAKLTDVQAAELRARHAAGEKVAHLARAFSVTRRTVRKVLSGKTWAGAEAGTRCGWREKRPAADLTICPRCGRALVVRRLAAPWTFKTLRAFAATHLGAPRLAQLVLGHTTLATTEAHYLGESEAQVREGLNRLKLLSPAVGGRPMLPR